MAKDNPFDTELVRELAKLIADTGLTEIEVEKGDLRIRVARAAATTVTVAAPAPSPASGGNAPPAAAAAGPARDAVTPAANHPGTVPSPMVGTAYRKASPEAKNFIEIGSRAGGRGHVLLLRAERG